MAEITLDWIGAKLSEVLDEMRNMRTELSAMRAGIDGGFHMMRGTDDRVEGLRRIDAHGQRSTALEKSSKP
jgi:hypothetical protein